MKRVHHTFTLVEILTVAAMICLIMSVILVAYNGVYRSWATSNTIAAMKSAHLALDRYKLENGSYPAGNDTLGKIGNSNKRLQKDLLNDCSPYSFMNGNDLIIFDDFGDKPNKAKPTPDKLQEIYYVHIEGDTRDTFMLISNGKDGKPSTNDEIIYLPHGRGEDLKPGFYRCKVNSSGSIDGDGEIETIND